MGKIFERWQNIKHLKHLLAKVKEKYLLLFKFHFLKLSSKVAVSFSHNISGTKNKALFQI